MSKTENAISEKKDIETIKSNVSGIALEVYGANESHLVPAFKTSVLLQYFKELLRNQTGIPWLSISLALICAIFRHSTFIFYWTLGLLLVFKVNANSKASKIKTECEERLKEIELAKEIISRLNLLLASVLKDPLYELSVSARTKRMPTNLLIYQTLRIMDHHVISYELQKNKLGGIHVLLLFKPWHRDCANYRGEIEITTGNNGLILKAGVEFFMHRNEEISLSSCTVKLLDSMIVDTDGIYCERPHVNDGAFFPVIEHLNFINKTNSAEPNA